MVIRMALAGVLGFMSAVRAAPAALDLLGVALGHDDAGAGQAVLEAIFSRGCFPGLGRRSSLEAVLAVRGQAGFGDDHRGPSFKVGSSWGGISAFNKMFVNLRGCQTGFLRNLGKIGRPGSRTGSSRPSVCQAGRIQGVGCGRAKRGPPSDRIEAVGLASLDYDSEAPSLANGLPMANPHPRLPQRSIPTKITVRRRIGRFSRDDGEAKASEKGGCDDGERSRAAWRRSGRRSRRGSA